MNETNKPSTLEKEAAVIKEALTAPYKKDAYFADAAASMREQALEAPEKTLEAAYDLLLRNLVNATKQAGEQTVMKRMGTQITEAIRAGYKVLGLDDKQRLEGKVSLPGQSLEELQVAFNDHVGLAESVDAEERARLIVTLMTANSELFQEDNLQVVTGALSKEYYINNVVFAVLRLKP